MAGQEFKYADRNGLLNKLDTDRGHGWHNEWKFGWKFGRCKTDKVWMTYEYRMMNEDRMCGGATIVTADKKDLVAIVPYITKLTALLDRKFPLLSISQPQKDYLWFQRGKRVLGNPKRAVVLVWLDQRSNPRYPDTINSIVLPH